MNQVSAETLRDVATAASNARDWSRAVELWRQVLAGNADERPAYLRLSEALWETGDLRGADAVLAEGLHHVGPDADLLFHRAHQAMRRRELERSEALWTQLRESFAQQAAGYVFGAVVLREQRKFDDADALLQQAQDKFPKDLGAFVEYAVVAQARPDWDAAATRWRTVCERFPTHVAGYRGAAAAFRSAGRERDAEAMLLDATRRFVDEPALAVEWAMLAHNRRDWADADERWARVRSRFPEQGEGYMFGALSLRELRRFDAADALLSERLRRVPEDQAAMAEYAWVAHIDRNWPEALSRWDALRAKWPGLEVGWRRGAEALRSLQRLGEADALLTSAMARFPHEPGVWIDLAIAAGEAKDWEAAKARWIIVQERFPQEWIGVTGKAQAYRELGDLDTAEVVLTEGVARLPGSSQILHEFARVAERSNDWRSAEHRWRMASDRFPNDELGIIGVSRALRRQGQSAVADTLLEGALQTRADSVSLAEEFALNAMAREDWHVALARLNDAQRRFPNADTFRQRVFEVQLRLAETEPDAVGDVDHAPPIDEAARRRALVMQFESLGGGGHGCEFGIFQRAMGAEPLGLLRWTDIFQDELSTILETEFEGVGDPEFTEIFVPATSGRPEYWTRDTRYHMAMRSFVHVDEVPLDRFKRQVGARFKYLKAKLIDDLRAGEKTFVYKNMKRILTNTEIERLHKAVNRYGNNFLVYIRLENKDNRPGSVEIKTEGLMIGYVDHFSHSAEEDAYLGEANDAFLMICREAAGMRQDQLTASAMA